MEIIVLGTGCAKCKTTYETVKKVIEENNLDINLTKQEDIMEIMKYNVMALPGIVVNGEVKIKGHVPSESEIRKLLGV
ncbi:thioredoxin family protein [Parabacteroides sp. OttesenSCG-928-O15]|nr:thioredoxin family protein [Parabacteroides sp. OttesenSCG-928-O15]